MRQTTCFEVQPPEKANKVLTYFYALITWYVRMVFVRKLDDMIQHRIKMIAYGINSLIKAGKMHLVIVEREYVINVGTIRIIIEIIQKTIAFY